jgi:uncharacterized protein (DUF488 family)
MEALGGMRLAHKFYTIGHSTRPIAGFVELLNAAEVRLVVDVRTMPRSRTNPQFDRDALAASLAAFGIEYRHIAELGGLRPRQQQVPVPTNAFWQNQSFHNYADYAMGCEFHSGFDELRELGHTKRCVIMCAETLWWRCHRRIISDYLIAAGESVFHILGPGQVEEAHLTPVAKRRPDGILVYPA